MKVAVDSSAVLAILFDEPERERFKRVLADSEPVISAVSWVETLRSLQIRKGAEQLTRAEALAEAFGLEIAAFGSDDVVHAMRGMKAYGKGRGQEPALLNFGDLFVYALAKRLDAPLVFKGQDFAGTDVKRLDPGAQQ